ncbi:KH domain-containing protein [Salimicrobium halophilum]|uniref:RNA-binding protein KhpA n=1 Tax=Salimicrobium halophilum TaxID=86666 RepID=A0A1G8QCT6_9BACI|nr:KH domain-containing protein [Salimicrobium halophilum]SDJ02386.1 RNA-binding protein (KH domain) [Salimicrobium halophilum]
MKTLLETIVSPLIDHPEELVIDVNEEPDKVVYHVTVHQDDVGKVIGKNGRIAKSIRTVVYAANRDNNKKVYVDIM